MPLPGKMAFISQSKALIGAILDLSLELCDPFTLCKEDGQVFTFPISRTLFRTA
jgi:hypothetical protein